VLLAAPWYSQDFVLQMSMSYWCGYTRQFVLGEYIDEVETRRASAGFRSDFEYNVRGPLVEIIKIYV
jgi:hypothetical protein